MGLLISDALAAAPVAGAQADTTMSMLMMAGVFLLFYFLILRPQNKKAKEHRELISKVKVGDEVLMAGGIIGEIKKINDQFAIVLLNDGVEMIIQRTSISAVMPKGTIHNIKKA
jgi:preprotein translocase subunit YajC